MRQFRLRQISAPGQLQLIWLACCLMHTLTEFLSEDKSNLDLRSLYLHMSC
jgi:hypothetical protein